MQVDNKQMFKIVLLVPLHDPTVQQTVSVSENFCEGNRKATEISPL